MSYMVAREILIFLIVFAAGILIVVFVGIVWMTTIWDRIAERYRENGMRRALERRGVNMR